MQPSLKKVEEFYQDRLNTLGKELSRIKRSIRNTSLLRLIVFVATLAGIYLSVSSGWVLVIASGLAGSALFLFLVARHTTLFGRKNRLETLEGINRSEIELLNGNTGHQDNGKRFLASGHPYAEDLDVFGDRSLFQLIDRSATRGGRDRLAAVLNSPILDRDLLLRRQQSIGELSAKQLWRQSFRASGIMSGEKENEVEALKAWAGSTAVAFDTVFYRIMLILNPLLGGATVLAITMNMAGASLFLIFLLLPLALIGTRLPVINREHQQVGKKGSVLSRFSEMFSYIQEEPFESALLKQKQQELGERDRGARAAVKSLSSISAAFDYRLNLLAGLFLNVFFLWDILQMLRIERWKKRFREDLDNWFDTLFEFDELCSFAGFACNHPESVYPGFTGKEFELLATNARHPFIDREECVGNEIRFTGWREFQVITGANMAGKSTYLRTTGVNLLLAMTGAPVLADSFVFTPVRLFTSIRTNDSLQDGESYFFAELKRLKQMIAMLESGDRLFVILDEILRGTNSADKRKGSGALLRQLVRLGSSGMLATHDLSMGELMHEFPENIRNKRFEVEIVNDELHFDYLLKDGISQNLNATFLMKKMGITLE